MSAPDETVDVLVVGAGHRLVRAEARQLGVEVCPRYTRGDALLSVNGEIHRYASGVPKLPLTSLVEFGADRPDQRAATGLTRHPGW
ncbi:hypothetical protein O1L60_42275 [Streptomyces diastatochromogenes]|nr:hypothetical protein [Streptomyces diastatochromogenes]